MPVGFWNDAAGERYRASYFADYPGIWRHGDWIMILPDGGCVIYGRSDATLNRGGIRMGTSEFYRVVERLPEIADSLVIDTGQLGREGRLILYVEPADGQHLTETLTARIRSLLRAELSPRHVPDEVIEVPGIPRTLSGKKLEVPVRKILLGTPVADAADPDALANPEVLSFFAAAPAAGTVPGGMSPAGAEPSEAPGPAAGTVPGGTSPAGAEPSEAPGPAAGTVPGGTSPAGAEPSGTQGPAVGTQPPAQPGGRA
jgi:hypothetical protein